MLSTFPAAFSGDSLLGNPFLPFGPGSFTFENYERDFPFHSQNVDENHVALPTQPCPEPLSSGSDITNPIPAPGSCEWFQAESFQTSNPGPNRRNSKKLVNPSSPVGPTVDDKRRRRMISNRDSARRSRLRKQKHLEKLRNQVNRHKVVKREIMNRLRLVVHQSQIFCAENECLRSEAAVLRQRLWDVRQVLLLNFQCINNPGSYNFHSLVT